MSIVKAYDRAESALKELAEEFPNGSVHNGLYRGLANFIVTEKEDFKEDADKGKKELDTAIEEMNSVHTLKKGVTRFDHL